MKRKVSFSLARVGAAVSAFALASLLVAPAVAFANTATTTVSSKIGGYISTFTTSSTVNVDVLPVDAAGRQTIAKDTVTVSSNNTAGYTLTLVDTDGSVTNLNDGGPNNIATTSGTAAASAALTAGQWGWRVDNMPSSDFGAGPTSPLSSGTISSTIKFAGAPTTAVQLKQTSSIASNDITDVWYSVAANNTQAPGTYTNGMTYTATAR